MKKLTPEDSETRSTDMVDANMDRLRELFPAAFTEGRVDFEVLKQLLGGLVDERDEKYGLNWHGKRRARQLALTPSTGTLRPCPKESVDWDTTQNLMIEGDNLEVLKLLQKSYSGKVKLIYIDPPYNTGKDFVYSDDFHDSIGIYLQRTGQVDQENGKLSSNTESSGRFHTAWLNMLYPRLNAARSLLTEDGVLLVSIDDNELASLCFLCDELFGEENRVATMVWEKGRKNDAKLVSVGHEYVVIYARSLSHLRALNTQWREEKPGAREIWDHYEALRKQHGDDDPAIEAALQAWYSALPKSHPSKKWSRYKRIDRHGPWRDRDISWPGGDGPHYDVLHPTTGLPCKVPDDGWRFSKPAEMQRQIALGLVAFRDDHTEPPFRKAHLKPLPAEPSEDLPEEDADTSADELATQVRGTYFYKQSQVAVKTLRKLLGAKVFNNPKDHEELASLFHYVTAGDPSALILDFFAGSGSSAHAVLELNHRDQGARRHILVQLPEPLSEQDLEQRAAARFCKSRHLPLNIAELTKERLRAAGREIRDRNPMFPGDVGFRVFKLDHSNIRAWDPSPEDLDSALFDSVEHLREGRCEQDVLYELLLKLGLDLCVPIEDRTIAGKTVHSIGAGTLFICLPENIASSEVEALALGIAAWHEELAPAGETTVVFRDSAFENDVAKTNLAAILQQHGLENVRSL